MAPGIFFRQIWQLGQLPSALDYNALLTPLVSALNAQRSTVKLTTIKRCEHCETVVV